MSWMRPSTTTLTYITNYLWITTPHRADTVHEITGGGFSSQVYSKLLRSTIAQAALTAAYASDVKSLEIIFKRHVCGVRDVIFDSLSALPETSQVATYDKLLPWSEEYVISSGAAQLSGRRTRDWSESEAYLKEINQCEAGDYDLARAADVSPSVSEIFDSLATREWLKSATEELCKLARSPNDSMTIHSNEEMETWTIRSRKNKVSHKIKFTKNIHDFALKKCLKFMS